MKKLASSGVLMATLVVGLLSSAMAPATANPSSEDLASASEATAALSPILDPVTVNPSATGQSTLVFTVPDGLTPTVVDADTVSLSDSAGNVMAHMNDPIAFQSFGTVNILLESTYSVDGQGVYQTVSTANAEGLLTTLVPTVERRGNADDAQMIAGYHEFFINSTKLQKPVAGQAEEQYVSVPTNYIYNTNHARVQLHDYCTSSPDSWGSADFRGPCARHDMCIEANLYKTAEQRRLVRANVCDPNLSRHMTENCQVYTYETLQNCYAIVGAYYAAVRLRTGFF